MASSNRIRDNLPSFIMVYLWAYKLSHDEKMSLPRPSEEVIDYIKTNWMKFIGRDFRELPFFHAVGEDWLTQKMEEDDATGQEDPERQKDAEEHKGETTPQASTHTQPALPSDVRDYVDAYERSRVIGGRPYHPSRQVLQYMLNNWRQFRREPTRDGALRLAISEEWLAKKTEEAEEKALEEARELYRNTLANRKNIVSAPLHGSAKQRPTPPMPSAHTAQVIEAAQGLEKLSQSGRWPKLPARPPPPYDWMSAEEWEQSEASIRAHQARSQPPSQAQADPAPAKSAYDYNPPRVGNTSHFATWDMDYQHIKQSRIATGVWAGHMISGGNPPQDAPTPAAQIASTGTTGKAAWENDEVGPAAVSTKRATQGSRKAATKIAERRQVPQRQNKRKAEDDAGGPEEAEDQGEATDADGDVDMDSEDGQEVSSITSYE
jgi:hypothetical protein